MKLGILLVFVFAFVCVAHCGDGMIGMMEKIPIMGKLMAGPADKAARLVEKAPIVGKPMGKVLGHKSGGGGDEADQGEE